MSEGFEKIPKRKSWGNNDPRAANKGKVKRWLKSQRGLGKKRKRG